jgi:hypothetical protein
MYVHGRVFASPPILDLVWRFWGFNRPRNRVKRANEDGDGCIGPVIAVRRDSIAASADQICGVSGMAPGTSGYQMSARLKGAVYLGQLTL